MTVHPGPGDGPRLHHLSLTCDDPGAVERFYAKHFGFRRVRVVPAGDGQIVFLRGAGTVLELFQAGQPSPLKPAENDGYPWAGVRNFSLEVDSVTAKLAEMGDEAEVTLGPLDFGEVIPGWLSAWIRDPAGNIVQLTQGYVDQEDPPPPAP
jgi:glyoxylase I family protein